MRWFSLIRTLVLLLAFVPVGGCDDSLDPPKKPDDSPGVTKERPSAADFFTMIQSGRWDRATKALQANPSLAKVIGPSRGWTGLHYAASVGQMELAETLLEENADPDALDQAGNTPLQVAAIRGQIDMVRLLLETFPSANPNQRNLLREAPLHFAARTGDEPLVRALLKNSANPNVLTWARRTPLHLSLNHARESQALLLTARSALFKAMTDSSNAVSRDDGQIFVAVAVALLVTTTDPAVQMRADLLSQRKAELETSDRIAKWLVDAGANVNAADSKGQTPFLQALALRSEPLVALFLKNKAAVKTMGIDGRWPLEVAIDLKFASGVKLLLEYGADPNAQSRKRGSLLRLAAQNNDLASLKFLIAGGANLDKRGENGVLPLFWIVRYGGADMLALALANKVRVDQRDQQGRTLLEVAVAEGSAPAVKLLLQHKADPKAETSDGKNLLSVVAAAGRLDLATLLTDFGADLDAGGKKGAPPLAAAVLGGHDAVALFLLDRGAKPNVRIRDKDRVGTVLHKAAERGSLPLVRRLVGKGAPIGSRDSFGLTPLHLAALDGHAPVIAFLLSRGAKVNARGSTGHTPLHAAATNGHLECAVLLLSKGADVDARSQTGETPLVLGVAGKHRALTELLIEKGASLKVLVTMPKPYARYQWNLLQMAASYGNDNLVELLLAKGMKVNEANTEGWTPLHLAASENRAKTIALLVKKGAGLEAVSRNGYTPLHFAAMLGRVPAIRALLAAGARVNPRDRSGKTPMGLATRARYREAINLLSKHGGRR